MMTIVCSDDNIDCLSRGRLLGGQQLLIDNFAQCSLK